MNNEESRRNLNMGAAGVVIRIFCLLCLFLVINRVSRAADTADCLNLSGIWYGYLRLINYGTQEVTAQIRQSGCTISISTMTSLPYGHYFTGYFTDSNDILAIDRESDETWTTFQESALPDHLELYDYVNEMSELDRMILDRIILRGDVNGNAVISLADAVLALQIITGIQPGQHVFAKSDLNFDNRIGIQEAIFILNQLATEK